MVITAVSKTAFPSSSLGVPAAQLFCRRGSVERKLKAEFACERSETGAEGQVIGPPPTNAEVAQW